MAKQSKNRRPLRNKTTNRLRIIGGSYRGRLINVADSAGLRPTGDRIRETLFNWLRTDIPGAICLDLFAGSGALGFESVSRGAASVTFVENAAVAIKCLRENIQLFSADPKIELKTQSALEFLNNNSTRFDIVFIDPPFTENLYLDVLSMLSDGRCLSDSAKIYIECPRGFELSDAIPQAWRLLRKKSAGQVEYRLLENRSE